MGDDKSRRRFLALTGSTSLLGLAGCLGGHHGEEQDQIYPGSLNAPLPEGYEDCVSVDGEARNPDGVSAKEEVDYQLHPNHNGNGNGTEMCANCTFFCPSNGQSRWGGCAVVAGGIRSQDWCALWQPAEHIPDRIGREER